MTSGRADRSVRVLIVDDHRLIREWMRSRLTDDRFTVVGEAATAAEAVEKAHRRRPDVIVLDLGLPDRPGWLACEEILADLPHIAVIVLSAHVDDETARRAVAAGARAYIVKDAEELDLPDVIDRVLAGESVLDPRIAGALLRMVAAPAREPEPAVLTKQELNVLRLVAQGLTNAAIGARLHLSRHTVKDYLGNAMRKLEASNRVQAVLEAERRGLIARNGSWKPGRNERARFMPTA